MAENNITRLRDDISRQKEEKNEEAAENFADEKIELTESEKAALAEQKSGYTVAVEETNDEGLRTETSLEEATESLDKKVSTIMSTDGPKVLKMVNNGDIKRDVNEIKEQARKQALDAFHSMSVNLPEEEQITDDDYLAINDSAIEALMKEFNMTKLDSNVINKKLQYKSLKQICDLLPKPFVDLYVEESELKANNVKAKERLLATINYLCVTGPELDYLNDYIDDENKNMMVAERLLQCQTDFSNALQDKRNWADILKDAQAISPADTSFWSKYIKEPNKVHNEFAQKAVLHTKYKEAYEKILEDYPVIPLADYLDDPEQLNIKAKEAASNERARKQIQEQIDESQAKIDTYTSIVNLERLRSLWEILWQRLKINKKTKYESLVREAISAIERVRRSKINLNFPGYQGNERKPEQIYIHYMTAYMRMILNYNGTISSVKESEPDQNTDIECIHIDGYEDDQTAEMFSLLLCILFGRVVKNLEKTDLSKYSAIELDAYFTLFCRMGLDIYVMNDVWLMMKDFVKYSLDTYKKPEPKGGKR